MMTLLALLFMFVPVQFCSALRYPNEYEFVYGGVLSLGVPEISDHHQGIVIEAKVVLQIRSKDRGVGKLEDVRLGNRTFLRGEESFSSSSDQFGVSKSIEELRQPFGFHLSEDEKGQMIVAKGQKEHITNILKAIMETMKIRKLTEHLQQARRRGHHYFNIWQNTMFGRCRVHYTFRKAFFEAVRSQYRKSRSKFNVTSVWEPFSAGSEPKEVVRIQKEAVDFDSCEDRVVLQRSSMGQIEEEAGGNMMKSIQTRSSTGFTLVALVDEVWEQLFAESEADVITTPFGVHSEKLVASTNKILLLKEIRRIGEPIVLPRQTEKVRTDRVEVASSFSPSKDQKTWINHHQEKHESFPLAESFSTGIGSSEFIDSHTKLHVIELLQEATEALMGSLTSGMGGTPWDGPGALATTLLQEVTKVIKVLPQHVIQSVHQNLKKTSGVKVQIMSSLFIDAVAASGTSESTRFLLKKMKLRDIPEGRIATIWATVANQLLAADVIPEIMDFVIEEGSSFSLLLNSMIHVNFATLASKFCINPSDSSFTTERDLFGKAACQEAVILGKFLPYIEKRVKESLRSNETAYLIQTLSNLRSAKTLRVLSEVATDGKFTNQIRTLALFAMEKRKMGDESEDQVFDILMELFESPSQPDEVRISAFITMVTWHPSATWWHQMARRTWHESSEDVAAFITFTIRAVSQATSPSMAKQAAVASLAVPFAKAVPASFARSFNFVYAKFLPREELDTRFHFEFLPPPLNSLIPGGVYAHLSGALGGLDFNLFEVAISSFGFDLPPPNHEILEEERNYQRTAGDKACGPPFFEDESFQEAAVFLQNLPNNCCYGNQSGRQANLLFRFFDNIYAFLPFAFTSSSHTRSSCNFSDSGRVAKFFNPFSSEIFLPSDVGIPIVFQNSLSVLSYANYTIGSSFPCSMKDWVKNLNQSLELNLQADFRVSGMLFSRVKTFVPLLNITLMVGLDNLKALNLPFQSTLQATREAGSGTLAYSIQSLHPQKFPLVYGHNIPFLASKPLFPLRRLPSVTDLQVLYAKLKPLVEQEQKLNSNATGLNFTLSYHGDEPFPFTSPKFMDMIKNPQNFWKLLSSPTTKFWKFSLNFEPAISKTKTIGFRTHYDIFESGVEKSESYIEDILQKLSESVKRLPATITVEKLKQVFKSQGPYGSPFSITLLDFMDARSKPLNQFRLMTVYSKQRSPTGMDDYLIGILFSQTGLKAEKLFDQQCILRWLTPSIETLDSLKAFIASGQNSTLNVQLKPFGYDEKAKNYATFEVFMSLSKTLRARILEDLRGGCLKDGRFVLEDLHTVLAFDELSLNVKYHPESILPEMLNVTYQARDLAKGIYFPHFSSDRLAVRNEENTIQLKGERSLPDSDVYLLRIECPQENIVISNYEMPFGVDKLVSYSNLANWNFNNTVRNDILVPSRPYCQITSQYTKTFDGLKINFPLTACPSITAVDISTLFTWLLFTKYNKNQEPEVTLLCFSHCITVVASANSFKINGEELSTEEQNTKIKDWYGYTVMDVKSKGSYKSIDFYYFLSIEIRNHSVKIIPKPRMKGLFRGMCGDFDGNPENDMTGPMLCTYDSPDMFGSSWIIPSTDERCNRLKWIEDLEEKTKMYQKICPIRPS